MSFIDNNKLLHLLGVIPVICFWTFANVLIVSTMAGITFIELISVVGWGKQLSLFVAILVAIAVTVYIWFQPKIRTFISRSN